MSQTYQPISIVTLLGEYYFNKSWTETCVKSWKLAENCDSIAVLSDGSLTPMSKSILKSWGLVILDENSINTQVTTELTTAYPFLLELRNRSNLFKKLLDIHIFYRDCSKVLYVDSDVLFRHSFKLPLSSPSFLFCIDDVSGYAGSWQIPMRYPIVSGLNSGFILFDPAIFNSERLACLNEIAGKFLVRSKNIWWLEQTCWAILAGLIPDKGIFDGKDACIISGLSKRTPEQIRANRTRFLFGSNQSINDSKKIYNMVGEASVVHFAGPGKPWIMPVAEQSFVSTNCKELRWLTITNSHLWEKILLALRMIIKG